MNEYEHPDRSGPEPPGPLGPPDQPLGPPDQPLGPPDHPLGPPDHPLGPPEREHIPLGVGGPISMMMRLIRRVMSKLMWWR